MALKSDRQSVLFAPHFGQGTSTGVGIHSHAQEHRLGMFQTWPQALQRK